MCFEDRGRRERETVTEREGEGEIYYIAFVKRGEGREGDGPHRCVTYRPLLAPPVASTMLIISQSRAARALTWPVRSLRAPGLGSWERGEGESGV